MKNGSAPEDKASINSVPALGILLFLIVVNYGIAGAALADMDISNVQRAAALFAGISLGYAGAGRFFGAGLRAVTGWGQDTCILVGTFLSHLVGALVAVWVGRLVIVWGA